MNIFLGNKKQQQRSLKTNIFNKCLDNKPMQKSTENIAKTRNENTPNFYNTGLYWYVDVRIMDIIVS